MSRWYAMPRRPEATPSPTTRFCSGASISDLRRDQSLRPVALLPLQLQNHPGMPMPAAPAADCKHPLDTFFSPSSIAIIGASRDPVKIPGLLLAFLRKNRFAGQIFPVNPNYPDIDGLRCYSSVSTIEHP